MESVARLHPWIAHRAHVATMASRLIVFLLIAVSGFALDLWTKHFFFDLQYLDRQLDASVDYWVWEGVLGTQPSLNQGALFGIGKGGAVILAGVALFAIVAIFVWMFVFKAAQDWWLTFPMSMIMGGIWGNLYDRLGLWHGADAAPHELRAVRDWIYFRLEGVPGFDPWPNFNIADSLLVCGAILLFVHLIWIAPRQEKLRAEQERLRAEQEKQTAEAN